MSFHLDPSVTVSALWMATLLKGAGGDQFLQRYRGIRPDIDRDIESTRRAAAAHARGVVNATLQALDRAGREDSTVRESVTSQEAADLLGITPSGVRKAIKDERLSAQKVGRQHHIDIDSLDEFRRRRDAHD